jgi:hypothetical protein
MNDEGDLGILHSIESVIIQRYRKNPAILDYSINRVLEWLIRYYNAQLKWRNFEPSTTNQEEEDLKLYQEIQMLWDAFIKNKNHDETILCTEIWIIHLKKIRKSVDFWTKLHGRQWYLNYVQEFIPN